MPIFLATWDAKIRRIQIQVSPSLKLDDNSKQPEQNELEAWFKQ
jgi:hypothetical protein